MWDIESNLSNVQYEILKKVALGKKEKEIASEISLSINTVKYHKKEIFTKLQVDSVGEAIYKAVKLDLLD